MTAYHISETLQVLIRAITLTTAAGNQHTMYAKKIRIINLVNWYSCLDRLRPSIILVRRRLDSVIDVLVILVMLVFPGFEGFTFPDVVVVDCSILLPHLLHEDVFLISSPSTQTSI